MEFLYSHSQLQPVDLLATSTDLVPIEHHIPELSPDLPPAQAVVVVLPVAAAAVDPQLHQKYRRRHFRHLHRQNRPPLPPPHHPSSPFPFLHRIPELRSDLLDPLQDPLDARGRRESPLLFPPLLVEQPRQVQPGRQRDDVERVHREGEAGRRERGGGHGGSELTISVSLSRRRRLRRRQVAEQVQLGVEAVAPPDPRGLHESVDGRSGERVGVEEASYDPLGGGREPRREAVVPLLRLPVHERDVGVVEGEEAGEQDVEEDPAGPGVGLGPVVAPAAHDLGRGVGRGAAGGVQQAVAGGAQLVGERGEAEVGELEVAVTVEEEVLGLDVAVGDAVGVAEAEGGEELLEVAARGGLGQAAVAREAGEELPAAGVLHDQVDAGLGGHDLVQPENVGVGREPPHGRDLAEDHRAHARPHRGLLVKDLHRHGGAVGEGPGEVDLREGAPAQEPAQLVPAEEDFLLLLLIKMEKRLRAHLLSSFLCLLLFLHSF
ncbi:putative CBL-interacting protein kinase 7 [Iris pallida]|uniref:CBL-interacting protein kinase 7 n=1 Tax=Iris pallida TaxID=29817 RepID=A0AAX6DTX8_IRIPA|nr:putative CBL-interacting protein kinase 7 [Iris pallida]